MLEEMIMKSNESESGCKTKLTNKLTNKTNVEQKYKKKSKINVNNFCGERKGEEN